MEIIFVANAIAPPLNDIDLVVQSFDEAERHRVLRPAVGGDAVPMPFDQLGKLLEWLQPLPAYRGAPLVEELAGPGLASVRPQLSELLLEEVGGIESLVRREERLESAPFLRGEILPVREEHILLFLDVLPVRTVGQALVLRLVDLIHRLVQMPQHMELVVEDGRLRCLRLGRIPERLLRVHDGVPDPLGMPDAEDIVEHDQARFRPVDAAKPDRLPALQIADDNAIDVPFRMKISSMPIIAGCGLPARASCARR